jgi:hypothetical protein
LCKKERFVDVLLKGKICRYVWNDVEIRLHVVKSLAQAVREVIICSLDEVSHATPVAGAPTRVLLAIRENQHHFELGKFLERKMYFLFICCCSLLQSKGSADIRSALFSSPNQVITHPKSCLFSSLCF